MAGQSNEVLLWFWGLQVSANGIASYVVAVAVSLLIVAVAWRLVRR